jgi:putative SOS response-associated peptidase YedK
MCFSVKIIQDKEKLSKISGAVIDEQAWGRVQRKSLEDPKKIQLPDEEGRIFPKTYAFLLIEDEGKKKLRPMRYQLLPHFSPKSRYTVKDRKSGREKELSTYNARRDGIETKKTWRGLLEKKRGILICKAFYEWVTDSESGKKKLLRFYPKQHPYLWAPTLFDRWVDASGQERIESFAIVTGEPPEEISQAGHDRCPMFLNDEDVLKWLSVKNHSKEQALEALDRSYRDCFSFDEAILKRAKAKPNTDERKSKQGRLF